MGVNDRYWMNEAMVLALKARECDEVPVGAVLVSDTNQLLGSGYNTVIQQCDPTAHAEINAIRQATQRMNNYRLLGSTLYVTLEPCAMCAGAIIHSRVQRVVFATRDFKTGAAGSVCNLFHPRLANYAVQLDEGVLQLECATILSAFFALKR